MHDVGLMTNDDLAISVPAWLYFMLTRYLEVPAPVNDFLDDRRENLQGKSSFALHSCGSSRKQLPKFPELDHAGDILQSYLP